MKWVWRAIVQDVRLFFCRMNAHEYWVVGQWFDQSHHRWLVHQCEVCGKQVLTDA